MILSCFRCQTNEGNGAAFQNERYGDGMRVHNETDKRIACKLIYRCTICNHERSKGQ